MFPFFFLEEDVGLNREGKLTLFFVVVFKAHCSSVCVTIYRDFLLVSSGFGVLVFVLLSELQRVIFPLA